MKTFCSIKQTALAAALMAALPALAANVVVTPGGVAGYLYMTPAAATTPSTMDTTVDCLAGFTDNYVKTFAAGEVVSDIVVNYWMKGGGGGGSGSNGGNGASVSSSFTIPAGYTGNLSIYVGRGGGTFVVSGPSNYIAGQGGGGYAGGGGGGWGYVSCAGCGVPWRSGGGGGGSSAILLGASRIAIAGGGGGGGGGWWMSSVGGNGVGASGGGGGGTMNASPTPATDVKGGVWNGVPPAGVGGLGNAYVQAASSGGSCAAYTDYYSAAGHGGTNGGGGGGGGGANVRVYMSYSCVNLFGGGGGGGGGAGGGGGGSGAYVGADFTSVAGLAGGNGGGIGVNGGGAPDKIAATTAWVGGQGGTAAGSGGAGGTLGGVAPSAGPGTYSGADPYLFLADKGVGGNGDTTGTSNTSGTSGGVFLKYSASECIIKAPF